MAYTIGDLVEHSVDRVPNRVVLVQEDRSFTFRELEERANRLAHHLQSVGVGPGDKVAVYSRNTIEAVEAMVAIFKIRAVMVNVNFRYVSAELEYLLDNSDAVAVIHERRYSDVLEQTLPRTPGVRHCLVIEDGTVTILGRGSISINTGGEKVHPEEVEAALKTHPDVFDALVIGIPDERMGQKVAAVIQTRNGQCPPVEELNEYARKEIARYKCPRALWVEQSVKRSPAGKPDYSWAAEVAMSRPADDSQAIGR